MAIVNKPAMEMMNETLSPEAKARSDRKAEVLLAVSNLAELREIYKVRQSGITAFSQPSVSRIERSRDIKLSTLIEYLSSMDLELEMTVRPLHPTADVPRAVTLLRA